VNCSAYPRIENKNILVCQKRGLVVIDPLPCIGDPAYDAG
jgi:streptomycin 6-kinase